MKAYQFGKRFADGLTLNIGSIYQVEELSLIRGSVMPEHLQFCDEITYAISGKAKFFSDAHTQTLSGGQIHFIKKGCMHKIEVDPDEDFRYVCLGFLPNANAEIAAYNAYMKSKKHLILEDDSTVRKLSSLLLEEFYIWDDFSKDAINNYLHHILLAVYRIANASTPKAFKNNSEASRASHTVYQVLRYIDQNFLHIEKMKDISAALSYNEFYLSHLFKEKTGTTIKEYVTQKKIDHACALFKSSPWSIEEIAAHLNFSSAHAFRRAFKAVTGKTPREYKNG